MLSFLFDVDDTLYDQIQPFLKAYYELGYMKLNLPIQELYKKIREHGDEVFDKVNSQEITTRESGIYRNIKGFEDFGVELSKHDAAKLQDAYNDNLDCIKLSKATIKYLEYLHDHNVQIGIITNGPAYHQGKKIRHLGLLDYFDKKNIFISGDYGVRKPDKAMFEIAEKAMKLDLNNTYYVGDAYLNDMIGADIAGWKTIWINRREHIGGSFKPNYTVISEEALGELLIGIVNKQRKEK